MNEMPLFADKSPDEIESIFNAYTERGFDDLPTDMFFTMMGDISEAANDPSNSEGELEEYVEIGSGLVGDTLVLYPPKNMSLPITVLGNEIIIGKYRIGLQWLGRHQSTLPSEHGLPT